LATEAAKDAYKNLKGFIQRLYDARKSSKFRTGRVILIDLDTGKSFTLPPQLPDEAWQQLTVAGLEDFALSVFRWDPETGGWQEIRYR
jgi:hypothetical protein